jgi:hypothetical protein
VEESAVPVSPVHHRGYRKPPIHGFARFFIHLQQLASFFGLPEPARFSSFPACFLPFIVAQ